VFIAKKDVFEIKQLPKFPLKLLLAQKYLSRYILKQILCRTSPVLRRVIYRKLKQLWQFRSVTAVTFSFRD
jgi:hypothetical protein